MDGIHDMGGMHGFGKVEPEPNEPVFHAPWEGRTLAMNRAMGYTGIWTIDQTRFGIEKLPPDVYLTSSYYRKWAVRLENLVVELGLAGADEIKAGHALRPGKTLKRKLTAADVPNALSRDSFSRPAKTPARFKAGDRVRTKNIHPETHTRLPRYARDKIGTIDRCHGVFVFPDTNAHFLGEKPQPLYSVRFEARELFGPQARATDSVCVDLWEDYLEPA